MITRLLVAVLILQAGNMLVSHIVHRDMTQDIRTQIQDVNRLVESTNTAHSLEEQRYRAVLQQLDDIRIELTTHRTEGR